MTNTGQIAESRVFTLRLFSIGLAIVYVCAFWSVGAQIELLYGPEGLQPLSQTIFQVKQYFGDQPFFQFPTLFLWNQDVWFVQSVAVVGAASAVLFGAGVVPPLSAFLAWICYLSLLNGGGRYMSFQWDILLVETGFLAIWLYAPHLRARRPSPLIILLLWWLNFRLMFASGAVKLLSQDAVWRDWTAMFVHFETTPLPNAISWYTHQLPPAVLRSLTGLTYFVELFLPWLIFLGRPWRQVAAVGFILLMLGIGVTGNYAFFNLLTMVLAATLLDDSFFKKQPKMIRSSPFIWKYVTGFVAIVVLMTSLVPLSRVLPFSPPAFSKSVYEKTGRFYISNGYGLFANMTEIRPELILEGTDNGYTWEPYHFHYKPGALNHTPAQVAPHQPRVDWQLWFAALGSPQQNRWVFQLMQSICQESPPVIDLFKDPPFAGHRPRHLRAMLYEYRYTSVEERDTSNNIWKRTLIQQYGPDVPCR